MKIRIHRKDKTVPLPVRKTPSSIGLDVYAAENAELYPGKIAVISTGLIIKAPSGYFYKIHIRSGLSIKNGICLANDVGIIDEDYCGPNDEVKVALVRLYNPADPKKGTPFIIEKGDRIAQIIFEKNALPEIEWDEMPTADFAGKDRGGFGSTGMK